MKPTDCHQHHHYTSSHPEHKEVNRLQSNIIFKGCRCSFEKDFNKHKGKMKSWFLQRNYREEVFYKEMNKLNFNFNTKSGKVKS